MKILTLNTWGSYGPAARQAVLLDAIQAIDADITCLQEVTDPKLLISLNYPTSFYAPDAWLAILTRYPAAGEKVVTYQTQSPQESYSRQLLLGEITVGNQSLWVGTTHLAWQEVDEPTRVAQVKELLETTRSLRGDILLSGDFNAAPESQVPKLIREAGFVDLFAHRHPKETGITWDNRNPFIQSHSLRFPDRRIDYLFLSQPALDRLVVKNCGVVGDSPGADGLPPSDHYGVLAEITFSA